MGKKEEGREDSVVDRENPPPTAEDVVPPKYLSKAFQEWKIYPRETMRRVRKMRLKLKVLDTWGRDVAER